MFTISEEVSIGYNHPITSTPTLKIQGITECTQDRYRQEIDNPMSQYHFHYLEARPLRLYVGDYVQLISDGNYTIPEYHLNYLRLPTDISILGTPPVACELLEQSHPEIIRLAVNLYLENKGDRRFQTQTVQLDRTA